MQMLKIEIMYMFSVMFSRGTHKLFDGDHGDEIEILEIMEIMDMKFRYVANHV